MSIERFITQMIARHLVHITDHEMAQVCWTESVGGGGEVGVKNTIRC